jgi:tRNA(Ile)-lysidine synthase
LITEFKKYLAEACCVSESNTYLVAVSGGIDSIVMAHLFKSAGFSFGIIHCNFGLRGEESDGDQAFVSELARSMNVPFYTKEFHTRDYASEQGISIQMAARDLRYAWFIETADKHGYDLIATGHNKNDIVETMLLNFSRGTGFRGLMGIRARHNRIIRPLLFASRQNIEAFARACNLEWREDSSNQESKYSRNKIRHTIVPAFESINPAFVKNALETSSRIEHTGKLLDLLLEQVKRDVWIKLHDRIMINIGKLRNYPSVDILLFELLRDFGVSQLSGEMLINTLDATTGKQFHTRSHTITHDRDHLIITPNTSPDVGETLIREETVLIDYPLRLFFSIFENNHDFIIPSRKNTAAFDADRISWPMVLRSWKSGDRFHPFGMKGSKKLSDFFVDIKLPLPDKKHVWILETGDEIAWVVNYRIDERFRVTDATSRILYIEYEE